MSGNASLTLDAGTQHVDIYVSDTLAISGQGVLNQSAKPTNLTFWGCGGNTVAWTLSGGSTSFYAVYAPTHPISLSGNSDFYGAFTGASVSHSGSGRIHFDEALAQRRQGLRVVAPGSWTEVLR